MHLFHHRSTHTRMHARSGLFLFPPTIIIKAAQSSSSSCFAPLLRSCVSFKRAAFHWRPGVRVAGPQTRAHKESRRWRLSRRDPRRRQLGDWPPGETGPLPRLGLDCGHLPCSFANSGHTVPGFPCGNGRTTLSLSLSFYSARFQLAVFNLLLRVLLLAELHSVCVHRFRVKTSVARRLASETPTLTD